MGQNVSCAGPGPQLLAAVANGDNTTARGVGQVWRQRSGSARAAVGGRPVPHPRCWGMQVLVRYPRAACYSTYGDNTSPLLVAAGKRWAAAWTVLQRLASYCSPLRAARLSTSCAAAPPPPFQAHHSAAEAYSWAPRMTPYSHTPATTHHTWPPQHTSCAAALSHAAASKLSSKTPLPGPPPPPTPPHRSNHRLVQPMCFPPTPPLLNSPPPPSPFQPYLAPLLLYPPSFPPSLAPLQPHHPGRGNHRLVQAILEAAVAAEGPERAKAGCINHTNRLGHSALVLACMHG